MNTQREKKTSAIIAMSGGVDSSVAAYLTASSGVECAGVMLKLFDDEMINSCDARTSKTCCSFADADDARKVAYRLDIPFYVYNFTNDFKRDVIDRFIAAYQNGATPNPCVDCNRYIKFDKLLKRAESLGKDYLVTGHYARIEFDGAANRYILKKALDNTKDQSYVLYALAQEQLARIKFPLGAMRKTETREIATRLGFVNANKHDSQDICFVRDGDYAKFIEHATGRVYGSGNFIDTAGKILGRHKGLIRYTVGQRKGLGIAHSAPLYVRSINMDDNTVTLCEDADLYESALVANDFNWIMRGGVYDEKKVRVKAKVRYNQEEQPAVAERIDDNTVRITFDEPQRAIAKGQAVVLYDNDIVVGGGTII